MNKFLIKSLIGGGVISASGLIAGIVIPISLKKDQVNFFKLKKDSSAIKVLEQNFSNKKNFFNIISQAANNILNKILDEKNIKISSSLNFEVDKNVIEKHDGSIKLHLKNITGKGTSSSTNNQNVPMEISASLEVNFSLIDNPSGIRNYINKITKINFSLKSNEVKNIPKKISISGNLNGKDGSVIYFKDGIKIKNSNFLFTELNRTNNAISNIRLEEQIKEQKILDSLTKDDIIKAVLGSNKISEFYASSMKSNVYLIVKGFKVIELKVNNIFVDLKNSETSFDYEMSLSRGKFPFLKREDTLKISGFNSDVNTKVVSNYIKYIFGKSSFDGKLATYSKLDILNDAPLTQEILNSWNIDPRLKNSHEHLKLPNLPEDIKIKYSLKNSINMPVNYEPNDGRVSILISSKKNPKDNIELTFNIKSFNKKKVMDELARKEKVQKEIKKAIDNIEESGIKMNGMEFELKELRIINNILSQVKKFNSAGYEKNILGAFPNGVGQNLYLLNGVDISSIGNITNWEDWSVYITNHKAWWQGFDITKAVYDEKNSIGSIVFMVESGNIEYAFLKYDITNNKWFAAKGSDRKVIKAISL